MRSQIELARPFLDEAARKTTPLVKPVRMPKLADPGFVDPPPEGPDPALPQADHTGDPPDENDRIGFPCRRSQRPSGFIPPIRRI